ncbi:MAG: hypothetical protein NT002_04975 [candidate division Zixibacteria bacterium]|nr:hypothetical protein [candidate division Zixibacteria bacterium]
MRRTLMVLSGIIILIATAASFAGDCGDVNGSETVNIQDITYLINFLYKGGPAPFCALGDVNNSGIVNIQDITYLINFLYKDGADLDCGPTTGTITDIDGNIYQTIEVCNQWWMAENLEVTHYRNGDAIPNVTDDGPWGNLFSGAYCEYNNDINSVVVYGRLYNWYAVDDSRNLAPVGWHVPSDAEWKQLEMYLGMSQSEADADGWRGADVGGRLKEIGTTHWDSPNTGATNESGFAALPAGNRGGFGSYQGMGINAYFWSSTEYDTYLAWSRYLFSNISEVSRYNLFMQFGFSVRCVKD